MSISLSLPLRNESEYSKLSSREEDDLEGNDSESTKVSTGSLSKSSLLLRRKLRDFTSPAERRRERRSSAVWTWVRWGTIVGLQTILIALMWSRGDLDADVDPILKGKNVETGGDINGLYKTCKYPQAKFDHVKLTIFR